MSDNYYSDRSAKNIEKLKELLKELPPFCKEYFIGIENTTSPLTRMNYAYDLRMFFSYVVKELFPLKTPRELTLSDLEQIRSSDIEAYLSYLSCYTKEDGTVSSCNERAKARKLSSIKSLFRYFFKKDKISVDHSAKVSAPKLHDKEIIRLDEEETVEILETSENGLGLSPHQKTFHEKNRLRDTAILTLFLGTGIRISELVGLNNDDVDLANLSFVVTRKGGNRMILYFSQEVADAIAAYLDQKEEMIRAYREEQLKKSPDPVEKYDEQALFLSLNGSRISVRAVECLVKKYARIVSPLKKISPHKLRSTFGTQLYDETRDIYVVAEVLGHKDVNTTKKHYASISDKVRREASTKVKLRKKDEDSEE
ncbi:MAG: tyrosine-type recombinase/integrase [Christensenellaceae bacterium]